MNSFFYLLKWSIRSLNVRVFLAQFYIFKIKLQPSSSLCFLRRLRRSIWCLLPSRQLKHAIISTMDSFFSLLRISHEEFNVCCVPALLKPSKTQLERFLLLSSQNPSTHRYVRVFLALFDISKSLTPGFMELPVLFESTISVYPKYHRRRADGNAASLWIYLFCISKKNNHRRAMAPALLFASAIPVQSSKEQRSRLMFCLFSKNTLERLMSAVFQISKYSIFSSERALSSVYSKLATNCRCLLRSRSVLQIQKFHAHRPMAPSPSLRLINIHPAFQIP